MAHSDAARDYLIGRQHADGITAREMARRLALSEANWCHVRAGRRSLAAVQILRACDRYPELRALLFGEKAS